MQFLPGVRAAVAAMVFGSAASVASAGALTIQLGFANSAEREGFTALVNDFRAANPDVEVHLNLVDAPSYRKALPASLDGDAAPDVFNWFAGEQMRGFAQRGQLEDLGDLWKANNWWTAYGSTVSAATIGGRQFALPYQYYAWGLFSRRDVLEAAGLKQAPTDLSRLITACSKLRKAGFTPIALAGKDSAAIGAWFDFIDMRTNGYEFHNQVLAA
jgi:multiple sugar transport system substrate-binding protein